MLSSREIVYKILVRLEKCEFRFSAENELHKACAAHKLIGSDRRLAREILFGCLRNKTFLEYYLSKFSSRKIEKIEIELKWIILTALYQLVFLDKVARYAAVNEAVSLCKKIKKTSWSGFVNGILRNFLREDFRDFSSINNPSIKFSNPEWLTDKWQKLFGKEKTEEILKWNNSVPETFALIIKNPEFVLEEAHAEFAEIASKFGKDILKIKNIAKALNSESFKNGFLYFMDPWSVKVSRQLPLKKDWKILDMCAAPGGKSIAVAARETVNIVAADNSKSRVKVLKDNLKRCRLNNIETKTVDSLESSKIFGQESFDVVLLDAPCSSVGVIRRHPEIRWKVSPESFNEQSNLQKSFLKEAVNCIKPGGFVLYSVCSFMPEENETVIECVISDIIKCIRQERDLPGENNTDGGFFALLQKLSS